MVTDLTQGSIKKHYIKYLGASLGSALISCVYGLIDAAVVGQYQGPSGSAALSIVMPIWTIIYSLGLLVGIGGSINYAYYRSQSKADKANAYFTLSLIMTTLIASICWAGIIIFEDQLLTLFGADEALLPLCKRYLAPIKFVIPAYPFTQFLSAFLRNDSSPALATFAVLFGGVFNVIGDIFFVFDFGLGLGIFGAGLATAIGVIMTNLIMLLHFVSKKNTLRLTRIYGQIHKAALVSVNGFSSFFSDIAMGIIAMLFNRQIMHYHGADALAVYGVIVQVSSIIQCTTYGIGQASQPILSQNYGIGRWDRIGKAQKYALFTVTVFGILSSALTIAFPNTFVRIFMSPTDAVLKIAPGIIRIYALSYLLLPLNIYAGYYFQSVMKSKCALICSVMRGMVICSALIFILPAAFGGQTVWFVMPITELVTAVYVIFNMVSLKNAHRT